MHEKKSFSQRAEEFLNGKGFYIVLFVCIAVIGVSAWLLLFSEFSPLNTLGDEGDYLETMGDVETAAPIDLRESEEESEKPQTGTQSTPAPDPAPSTAPEHDPEPKKDDTLTVVPEPEPEPEPEREPEPASEPTGNTDPEPEELPVLSVSDLDFIWPLNGDVSVPYSPTALLYDRTMGDWRTHDGVDLAAPLGTKVMAVADGMVMAVTHDPFYGTTVVIDHGAGVESRYANLTEVPTVKAGDAVTMGSVIGAIGNTSLAETGEVTHLHFSLTVNGASADPGAYLPRR